MRVPRKSGLLLAACAVWLLACNDDSSGPPPTEVGFIASGSSSRTVTLVWLPAAGATGYSLERRAAGGEFSPVVTLDASAIDYLDTGLSYGTYTYRLSTLGVSEPAKESTATTLDVDPVVTSDDAPLGDPVQAAIGAAGGTIALPDGSALAQIPPNALADGVEVVVQAIANPTDSPGTAVRLTTSGPRSLPVKIGFPLSDEESAAPEVVAVAVKSADGMWLTQTPQLADDGHTLYVTLSPSAPVSTKRASVAAAAPSTSLWAYKFRRVVIDPPSVYVRSKTERTFSAFRVVSKDPCWNPGETPILCHAVAPLYSPPIPITKRVAIKNSDADWKLNGPGTLVAPATSTVATYTAPAVQPGQRSWEVTLSLKGEPHGSASATITWVPTRFRVQGSLNVTSYPVAPGDAVADIKDGFQAYVEFKPDEASGELVGVVTNLSSVETFISNVRPELPGWSVTLEGSYEALALDSFTASTSGSGFYFEATGTTTIAGAYSTSPEGVVYHSTGGTLPMALLWQAPNLGINDIFAEVTLPGSDPNWNLTITPLLY